MAKEGSVAPKERINITFKPATGGAQEEIELPLKLLVIGDYVQQVDERKLEDRKPVAIDKMTFDEVLAKQGLSLSLNVPNRLQEEGGTDELASTVAVLLIEGRHGVCLWAGDSRCYLWRQHMLYQLSRDHSFQQRLIEQEHMSHRHACAHPDARALTRAVGAAPALALEVLEFEVQAGDVFLLCSDGIYQELTPGALGQALSVSAPELAVARLFDDVLSGAARDNLCAVVIAQ